MTNPNPVAPKTDTPATQDRDVKYVDDMRARLDRASNRIDEMSLVKQQQTERIKSLENQVAALESTLAAERASREQAEEQRRIEAGIVDRVWKALGITTYAEAKGKAIDELVADLRASRLQAEEALDCLKMEIMVLYGCDTPEVAFSEIEHLIKKYFPPPSKPSVSPEQEKP